MTGLSSQLPTPGRAMAQFAHNIIMGVDFEITSRQLEPIGVGVSDLVCSANDQILNQTVAVKKLAEPFKSDVVTQHMFREIKLLKQLKHENLIQLYDIFISPSEDIYLVTELMATDLHTLLKTKKVDNQFTQFFLYQIMRGLKYVHSAGVIHRDLKPSNILVNENCDLKICDFGLARAQENKMTGYVSTRYYRAPEIMLTWRGYNEKVDIWSVGCIFAEMILGRPLFPGKNCADQFCVITRLLGSPPASVMDNMTSPNTLEFIRSLPKRPRKPLSKLIPDTNAKAIVLLENLLQIDPVQRCSAAEGLESQYLAPYHDPDDEPKSEKKFDWSLREANLPANVWRSIIYAEVLNYHESAGGSTQLTPQMDGMNLS
ncbi:uncharacterized protein N7498_008960 [Penicillium cinerascens]|uniref:mitogen-activated protein kinase n=1 Tax=Penicillium cinerascens TaxID=70096 RepID=A0A9W9JGG6_9EURO|nr:uncharacterized protein N7498_008960 [Penicillium cinerascens]KAJ5195522.1 hypothetical protein N7498_008960 [Penicillium cinerascens]